ncbi:hypothetical protein UFOVP568_49 [uncultured Caudovirales phage]|jgi:hypothetical protein|uniref:Uncharacterized protein n=1 Tax=uncultured Caudovirales phage TaxID=2100421 RepID=A0A6J5MTX3_9CAUD|nr:hypothetical protein UFOVP568_49 [uncultured Caudovirales phage]
MAITKKFEVEVIKNRKLTEKVYSKVDGRLEAKTETRIVPVSYMVYSPNGTSVWFESKEAMAAAGITDSANFTIDTDTGMPVEPPQVRSIKSLVESKTRDSFLTVRSAE